MDLESPNVTAEVVHNPDRFADIEVLRYRVPGFQNLDLERKKLCFFLYQAALCGRDIIWDQNYRHNLMIRRTLEEIVKHFQGDRHSESFEKFMVYTKRVWFSNGIHHHYSNLKLVPEIDFERFRDLVHLSPAASFPLRAGQSLDSFLEGLRPLIFEASVEGKKVNKAAHADLVRDSAVNYYQGVTRKEVESYHAGIIDPQDFTPPSHGLNSRLVKQDGKIVEKVWKVGGLYGEAIEPMVFWLKKAAEVAETPEQRCSLEHLIDFYQSGDLRAFDRHTIAWLRDTRSDVDMVSGFIESYNDPLGFRGSFEAIVSLKDKRATRRIETIAGQAQWFEDHSPIMEEHKKSEVRGIIGTVINVVVESGDSSPSTPIGINLPNADWIRERHGSKSVNLANIVTAMNQAQTRLAEEFAFSAEEVARAKAHSELGDNLHTDLHEVIGHASGRLNPGVATPKETLKNYYSTLEEARADLVALYYLMDPKLLELGLIGSLETGKSQYDSYIRNGLMVQLRRLSLGEDLEEDHMRNRQLIARWAYQKGVADGVIVRRVKEGKTYFVVTDYEKLRALFAELLREIQRIKSEGDYEAGVALVETYGVKVDPELHREVRERFQGLNEAPFHGLINPRLVARYENDHIVEVRIEDPADFTEQMLEYAADYSLLPTYNESAPQSQK